MASKLLTKSLGVVTNRSRLRSPCRHSRRSGVAAGISVEGFNPTASCAMSTSRIAVNPPVLHGPICIGRPKNTLPGRVELKGVDADTVQRSIFPRYSTLSSTRRRSAAESPPMPVHPVLRQAKNRKPIPPINKRRPSLVATESFIVLVRVCAPSQALPFGLVPLAERWTALLSGKRIADV